MLFRTEIKLKTEKQSISYSSKILLIGSCFSQNIGDKLAYYKLDIFTNPLGVLFHPKAIENVFVSAINDRKYTEDDLVFQNERWHCLDAHSDYSHSDKNKVLVQVNTSLQKTKTHIQTASHILITLGTSWVYQYNKSNSYVANCHKIPQKEFHKKLLSVNEIVQSLQKIKSVIHQENPKTTIVFTVSPVRHIKDGFVENQQSKAHLLTAIHQVTQSNVFYFPAYEIMMDDLRDYRFYKKDMIHPNETAVDYIWRKFTHTWMDLNTLKIFKEVVKIQKGLAHRPFDKQSKSHQIFLGNLTRRIGVLKEKGILFNES